VFSRKGIASAVLVSRVAYGAGLVAVPARLSRRWLGPAAERPPTQVGVRGLGAREVLLHAGALATVRRGGDVRPWFAASVAGDLTDITATALARRGLPDESPRLTLLVAGASALLSVVAALVWES
jgi:hypothetical protein